MNQPTMLSENICTFWAHSETFFFHWVFYSLGRWYICIFCGGYHLLCVCIRLPRLAVHVFQKTSYSTCKILPHLSVPTRPPPSNSDR